METKNDLKVANVKFKQLLYKKKKISDWKITGKHLNTWKKMSQT